MAEGKKKRKYYFGNRASTNFKLVDICSGDLRAARTPCISIKAPCRSKGLAIQRSPTDMESNELISSSRKSSNDSELWDLPGSLEPDTMAGRFPSVCFGVSL